MKKPKEILHNENVGKTTFVKQLFNITTEKKKKGKLIIKIHF